ncbi:polysulfide reductase [Candidatus Methanoperedens nitroreducens]|uniref:Polysulfide reductase n=1 Tax=Candidatus Methanoperedens nitratireducens TaxID=1392998 RepID=A0A062UZK8_9EURY|nr:NrfD/PsrC family molybdoenzyme membrane anchor subunit [Candidatus Methanoperedens nitroreducens]KCZ70602.1 polysulfide reductase [Candidatus Methanoperedens nitroreducens]MDJ1420457.1 polysulfide reductase NrfD [Candidatus Methanoperedens sp.]
MSGYMEKKMHTDRELTGAEIVSTWLSDKLFLGLTMKEYVKTLITPLNMVAGLIVLGGLYFILLRFIFGLEAVTEASNEQPWGLFLSWGLFSGVPFSASGFVIGTAVYIFGLKRYQPVVKNAILLGFLGYLFAVVFLMIDLGRPWRIYYPMFVSFGTASVMFLVAWHVALYLSVQFFEFSPSTLEWLGLKNLRKLAVSMTLGLTIFGVMLSTLHQSALSAMFLLAPGKLHPLWYTSYLPWLAFISSIGGAIALVIVVSRLTQVFLKNRADSNYLSSINDITLGLGKAASLVLFTYLGLRLISVTHEGAWMYLNTPFGYWFLVEITLLATVPFLFYHGVQKKNVRLIQYTAALTMVGIIMNRFNISLIAFNWQLPHRELFFWKEAVVVVAVVTIEILVYRWIVNRMPVLRQHPDYMDDH